MLSLHSVTRLSRRVCLALAVFSSVVAATAHAGQIPAISLAGLGSTSSTSFNWSFNPNNGYATAVFTPATLTVQVPYPNNVGLQSGDTVTMAGATVSSQISVQQPYPLPGLASFTTSGGTTVTFDGLMVEVTNNDTQFSSSQAVAIVYGNFSATGFATTPGVMAYFVNMNGTFGTPAFGMFTQNYSPTPEPSTLVLAGCAALGLVWQVRRRRPVA